MSGISRLAAAAAQDSKPGKKKAMGSLEKRIKNSTAVENAYPERSKK